ncbi:MAG: putative metal-binding motif-containing protein, partial [Polyangiales bacterium]
MNNRLVASWISLLSTLATLAAAPGCAERRAEGGSCVFNDDCADPLICAGSFCRAQCRTDRDCPASWICHNAGVAGKQVCLPPPAPVLCVTDEHCPAGASCTPAHQCRWRCARDVDCAARRASLTCAPASVCSEPLLVIELQLPARDGGEPPSDAPADDVTTPADTPPVDAAPTDATLTDATPTDATPTDATATDTAPTDTSPADAPTVDTSPSDTPPPVDATPRCGRDFQCDDGVFCNGAEVCAPTDPAADARGCAPPTSPRCMTGQRCDERMGRCLTMCEVDGDADDDGFDAVMCGGPDCDDARASVHPGAPELCNGRDDDCDAMTDEAGAALCSLAFATAACRAGACGVATCSSGYGDCDGVGSNGCESPLSADALNCGACGRICAVAANAMTMGCRAGACVVATCRTGFADCDGMSANGCELDARADVVNCGRCGNRCTTRPNATASCVDGACAITCATGRADCDGDAVNGCEVDLQNDRAHCGACRSRCPVASDGCVAGSCVAQPFASDGSEGAFEPSPGDAGVATVRLAPGVHQFTTVRIPEGVRVVTSGDGVLELRASGDVVIDGVVDVSGGRGGDALRATGTGCGGNGGGGATGNVTAPGANGVAGVCAGPGGGGAGSAGGAGTTTGSGCGLGGSFGGGAGGTGGTGGGGGGVSGGIGASAAYVG